jgi:hypothetical protein
MIVCYNSRQKITAASSVRLFLQFLEGALTNAVENDPFCAAMFAISRY